MAARNQLWVRLAAASGMLSVAAGAFAAHQVRDPSVKELIRTGSQYEAVHALATLAWVALVRDGSPRLPWTPVLFLIGSALFSGSIYALAAGAPRWFGAVTPLGGLMFLAGWGALAMSADLAPAPTKDHSDA